MEVQQLGLKYQELALKETQQGATNRQQEKQEEDLVMAETEANSFLGECSLLGDIMVENKTTFHLNESDERCWSKPVFQSRKASPQSMADRNSLTREAIGLA